jgi:hypothetical protein
LNAACVLFEKRLPAEAGSLNYPVLPGSCQAPEPDLQKLDFRVQSQPVLLHPEDIRMEGDAVRRILPGKQILDLRLECGLLGPEAFDFLADGLNLLRF